MSGKVIQFNLSTVAKKQRYKHYILLSCDSRSKVKLNRAHTLAFLHNRGFYLFRTSVNKHIFIRIVTNIVKEVGIKDLRDEIISYCYHENDAFEYDELLANIGAWLNNDLFMALDEKKIDIKRDTKDSLQVFFANCYVTVTKDDIICGNYKDLEGLIWESQIIQREFYLEPEDTEHDFAKFIWNISNKDKQRRLALTCSIGFLIHNFKNPSNCPAIVLNDEVISDNPEGGTGKGLIGKVIKKFCNVVTVDGKVFTFDKGFLYSRINNDSRVIFFDDVKKSFDFEKLFSVITEGITTEKKGKDELYMEFSETPKILISTNYALRGSGNSHRRRRHEIEIAQYYNENITPELEFGRMMFDDWDSNDWVKFDNYIITCGQLYLKHGLVKQDLIHLPQKRAEADSSIEFIEFMDDYRLEGRIPKQRLFDDFVNKNTQFKNQTWFTRNKIQSWVKSYCEFKGINCDLNGFTSDKKIRCFVFDGQDYEYIHSI